MAIPDSISELRKDLEFLSAYSNEIIEKPDIKDFDFRQIIIASLFAKIVSGAQAIKILNCLYYSVEAAVIARSTLDALFFLGVCGRDEESYHKYIELNLHDLEKLVNLTSGKRHIYSEEVRREVKIIHESVVLRQKGIKGEKLTFEKAAIICGLEAVYEYPYRMLSGAVHSLPDFMFETYVDHDEDKVKGINLGPNPQYAEISFVSTNLALLQATRWYMKGFGLMESERFSSLFDRYMRPE